MKIYNIIVNKNCRYNEKEFKKRKLIPIKNINNDIIFIEKKTYKNFLSLQKKLIKKEAITIGIKYAHRSFEEQELLYNNYIDKYGKKYTSKIVALPGFSEHHTGLAIDVEIKENGKYINNNENLDKVQKVLEKTHKYLYTYGFILRYPKGKEKKTEYPYEPWHFRYVGKKMAKRIFKNKLILEDLKR